MVKRAKRLNPPDMHKPLAPMEIDNSHIVGGVCKTCNGHGWLCKKPCWDIPRNHDGKPCADCKGSGCPPRKA